MFVIIIDYVLYVLKFFMKKVFIQIRQLILKHRKRLIYGVLAFLIGQICFFGLEEIWIERNSRAKYWEECQKKSWYIIICTKINICFDISNVGRRWYASRQFHGILRVLQFRCCIMATMEYDEKFSKLYTVIYFCI